jgi:branched-chain amino acid transport system substrate-binding protein
MVRKSIWVMLALTVVGLILPACQPGASSEPIKIGGVFDLSGATSDVGVPYANGVRDYVTYLNQKGGINGRQVNLVWDYYAYDLKKAETLYNRLVKDEHVIAILGWGTGDTEKLRPWVAADKIPLMSASYSEGLAVISDAPYNFLIGVTYSDQMRIALRYISDNWKDTSRKPRVVFFYNDTAFGKSPLQAGRDYAAGHNIELVSEQIVPLNATDANAQLQAVVDAGGADFGIIQETTGATVAIVKSAGEMKLGMQFIALNWGTDEALVAKAGAASEGVLGTSPFAFPHEQNVAGVQDALAALQTMGKGDTQLNVHYLQGWTTARVMLAAVAAAGANPTGEDVHRALEGLTGFDTGGITAPLTFTATRHKGATALKLYQVKDGLWQPITDYIEAVP